MAKLMRPPPLPFPRRPVYRAQPPPLPPPPTEMRAGSLLRPPPPPPRPSTRLRSTDEAAHDEGAHDEAAHDVAAHDVDRRLAPPLMPTGMHEVPRTLAPQVADVPLHTSPPPSHPQRRATAVWVALAAAGGLVVGLLARTPSHREVTAPAAAQLDAPADAQEADDAVADAPISDDVMEPGLDDAAGEPLEGEPVLEQPIDDRAAPSFEDEWTPPTAPREGEEDPSAAAPAPAAQPTGAAPLPPWAPTDDPYAAATSTRAAAPAGVTAGAFDRSAASSALDDAMTRAAACRASLDPSGTARVAVTFAPSGRSTQAVVTSSPFAGTMTGGCIARAFRDVSVSPFSGGPVTVTKTVPIR